jgi:hypothetical protein
VCAGFVVGVPLGALARQPEINNLHKQVSALQKEVTRLNGLVDEQNRQISALKLKYNVMQGMRAVEIAKAQNNLKGAIMYSYCLREYLDLQVRHNSSNGVLSPEEGQFRECFMSELNGLAPQGDKGKVLRHFLRLYIRQKYAAQIDGLIECDLAAALRRAGEAA